MRVRETTRPVVERAKHVAIDASAVEAFCSGIKEKDWGGCALPYDFSEWGGEERAEFMLLFNVVNFCYWVFPGEEKWACVREGGEADGALGFYIALARAIDRGVPLLDGPFLSTLTVERFNGLLRGRGVLPMIPERVALLREAGSVLTEIYGGRFLNVIMEAEGGAYRLAGILVESFPGFRDVVVLDGAQVEFHKRAQLAAKMLHDALPDHPLGRLSELDRLTAFADYKIPQILRGEGILRYAEALAGTIDAYGVVPAGSREEVEIRAATVWACEAIREELKKRIPEVTAADVDSLLWLRSQRPHEAWPPYHRTRTIFY